MFTRLRHPQASRVRALLSPGLSALVALLLLSGGKVAVGAASEAAAQPESREAQSTTNVPAASPPLQFHRFGAALACDSCAPATPKPSLTMFVHGVFFGIPGLLENCQAVQGNLQVPGATDGLNTVVRYFSYSTLSVDCTSDTNQSLVISTQRLQQQIVDGLLATGATHVNVIGHSLGGAVAMTWLANYTIPGVTVTVVTLDSPINGCLPTALTSQQYPDLVAALGTYAYQFNAAIGICLFGSLSGPDQAGTQLIASALVQKLIAARQSGVSYHVASLDDIIVAPFSAYAWELGPSRVLVGHFGDHYAVLANPATGAFVRAHLK